MLSSFSHVWLFVTPWTIAHQAPLSMEISRQEYWSGLPCPPPGDLPDPGIKLMSPALQMDSLPAERSGRLYFLGFLDGAVVKNPPANAEDARDVGLIPGLGRSPGERNGNPLQYSCLGIPMDRGAWWATVHGVTLLDTTKQLSTQTILCIY